MFEFVKPMLAKTAKNERGVDHLSKIKWSEWIAEMKFDGHRRLMARRQAWSRLGTAHEHPEMQNLISEGVLLDGEILIRKEYQKNGTPFTSSDVGHWLAHPELRHQMEFVAFDILYLDGQSVMDAPWKERRTILMTLFNDIHQRAEDRGETPFDLPIRVSNVYPVFSAEGFEKLMTAAGEKGLEGLMLKKMDAPYKPNSRSSWMKVKFTVDYDVVITDCDSKPTEWRVRPGEIGKDGVLYPEGRHSDPWISQHVGLSYGFYDTHGKLVVVGSLGHTGPREEMERLVGKVVKTKSYGPAYPTGALRHPVILEWRDDKAPEECVFDFENGISAGA